jgi:type VI secretion system protein ImpB
MTARNTVPRSRITLTYDTRQPDQPRKEKELPLRLLVVGDLTGRAAKPDLPAGATPPPKDDFEDRKIHDLNGGNLDAVMKKMNISVQLQGIANHIDKSGGQFDVTIPITSMASFEPGEIVNHVPPVQRLLRIRELLLKLQASVDNNKPFRQLVRKLTSPPSATLLENMREAFKKLSGQLRIHTKAEMSDPAKPDPAKPDPAKPDPAKPDPAKPDPAKPDPAKPDPAKPDPR